MPVPKELEKYKEQVIKKVIKDLKTKKASNPRGYYPSRYIEYRKRGKYIREVVIPKEWVYEIAKRMGYKKKDVVWRFVREFGAPRGKGHRILLAYFGKVAPKKHKYCILASILHPVAPGEPCMFRVKVISPYKITMKRGEAVVVAPKEKKKTKKVVLSSKIISSLQDVRVPKYRLIAVNPIIEKKGKKTIITGFDDLKIVKA